MIDVRIKAFAIALSFLLAGLVASPAQAQSCSAATPVLDFGTTSADGTQVYAGSTVLIFCNGTANNTIRICPYVGTGSYPAAANGPRRLGSGTARMDFDVFEDVTFSKRFANGQVDGANGSLPLTLNSGGSATANVPIYGRIPTGATTGATSTLYSASMFDSLIVYGYAATFSSCTSSFGRQFASFNVNAQVNVQSSCSVTTSAVAFGSRSSLATQVDATGTVTVACGSGTSYSVALDGGANGGTSATTRKMASGANRIAYGLFRDAARTAGWYSDASSLASGTGTGSAQTLTVYGRVGAQPTPTPGPYSDSVVVTVSY